MLLAEDNFPDVFLVREALRSEGLKTDLHVVSDGASAIDFLRRAGQEPGSPCPDLVLLDINLPKRDGFEVLRELRASETLKDTPVLMFSSSDAPGDRAKAAELGAGYFRKPPSYDEFLRLGGVIRRILERD